MTDSYRTDTASRRRQVIIRERLKFPSGFSTAVLISMLHGRGGQSSKQELDAAAKGGFASLVSREELTTQQVIEDVPEPEQSASDKAEWAANMRLLLICFGVSGLYTISTYFFPILRNLPIFGTVAAQTWLWTLNPSLAYVGQGIIMGTETTMHMLLGAVLGWGILSPIAKAKGWAPGEVDDWEHGSKGWIVWISLAIMLVDAIVSLSYVALHPIIGTRIAILVERAREALQQSNLGHRISHRYSQVPNEDPGQTERSVADSLEDGEDNEDNDSIAAETQDDAPPEHRIGSWTVIIGLILSIALCILTVHLVFGNLVPLYATIIAVLMALVLSIMGVRALGETDLNPVSGISKLAQLFFAFIIPQSHKSSVLINLVAGAIVRSN